MNQWTQNWSNENLQKLRSAQEAVTAIQPMQRIFIGSGAAAPHALINAFAERAKVLHGNEVIHILTLGNDPTMGHLFAQNVRHSAYFVGGNARQAVQECRADYTPIFLSEIPALFKTGTVPIDVSLIHVSLPDAHGFCSYGVAVDIVKSATEAAKYVIAQVNPKMPRALGDSFIHISEIDAIVFAEEEIPELEPAPQEDVTNQIGKNVASLVEDGATLQMGIGAIPDAVLRNLFDKKDLGIHTEMFADGVLPLVKAGIINGEKKTLHRRKIITSFVMGTRAVYNFIHDNPMVEFRPSQYTNDPFIIAQNDKMTAINSALEVDITGQVCADSIGHKFYSGIGGQVDFIRGSARAKAGKPIIALPATAKNDQLSRIVVHLSQGAGVVTTRGDVHYVVTEYGIAYLHGKNIRQRTEALIQIAHPKFREQLRQEAKAKGYIL